VRVILDRDRAAQLGITAADVAQTLSLMTGGVDVATSRRKTSVTTSACSSNLVSV